MDTIKFEVGQSYIMRSPCDYDCTWVYFVARRTASMIVLFRGRVEVKKCKVKLHDGVEHCQPLGRYSMSPILSAEKRVA